MLTAAVLKKSHLPSRALPWPDMGRPRKNPPGEGTVLSFRVTAELRDAIDKAVEKANAKQPWRSMSRTELIKLVLYDWLERGAKPPK